MGRPGTIITGSSGGIGTALSEAFNAAGYFTVGLDKVPPAENALDAFVSADLATMVEKADDLEKVVGELVTALNGRDLAVLVNNAALQVTGSSAELALADFQSSLNVNLLAPFLLIKELAHLLEDAKGCVINIGSIHARLTKPRFVAYATSKAALEGMTRALAVDLGGKIRVNGISPAAIETDMLKEGFADNPLGLAELQSFHPAQKLGTPGEIASAALYLAAQKAAFLTGTILSLDGGIASRLHDPV